MATASTVRLDEHLADSIVSLLAANSPVRRILPPDGRMNVDRQLPFLFVYRQRASVPDPLFSRLLASGASFLLAPSTPRSRPWVSRGVRRCAAVLAETFGSVLIIELWPERLEHSPDSNGELVARPAFELLYDKSDQHSTTVATLAATLAKVAIMKQTATVTSRVSPRRSPAGLPALLTASQLASLNATLIGVQVDPIYLDRERDQELPLVGRALARQVSRSLQESAFEFARTETTEPSLHYHALGRRMFVAAVKNVDQQLTALAESFDLLQTITPADTEAAFRKFRRSKHGRLPRFHYRPSPVDPDLLKRTLWDIKIERVEDLVLEQLFREKRRELDLKITMIAERERPQFLPTSLALYGRIPDRLIKLATKMLEELPGGGGGRAARKVSANDFVTRAQHEFDRMRNGQHVMDGKIVLRDDVSSLMVSSGNLIIGANMSFPADRVGPLIQHEVGTHVLTYWNGRAQPFKLLATGLAGHDELQEGLAVFVEYLVGGLTPARMRTLAGRVLAANSVVGGASFIETFQLLHDDHGFGERAAFMIAMRVHRGGGLTKDAVYLQGLKKVADYLKKGGRLDTLFVGKIATEHVSVIEELQRREVLVPPPFRPSYLDQPDTHYRIEHVRRGMELHDLVGS